MKDLKILFAEDSPTMRRIIMNSLQRIGLKDVLEAENGADALEKLNGQTVDLVMTDWNMPEMNGEELVKKLRSDQKYEDTPILMITTRGMKEDVITAIKAGVNGYIVKPFTPDMLQKKIVELVG